MSSSGTSGGIGFFGVLTIVFVTLKLTNVIDWSWFWVLSPIWLSFCLTMLFMAVMVVAIAMASKSENEKTMDEFFGRNRPRRRE